MPGSGKSTIGVLLAKALTFDFIDTDLMIQSRTGTSLQNYLETHGVDALRDKEEEVILTVKTHKTVIATGGSAVYGEKAMSHLGKTSEIVFLDISLETMVDRLGDFSERGIAKPKEMSLEQMFQERRALYQKYARLTVDGEAKSPEVCAAIQRALS